VARRLIVASGLALKPTGMGNVNAIKCGSGLAREGVGPATIEVD